jgi:hypothetical protein
MANTERRNRTKRGILIALLLVLLIYIIGSTYARYTNSATLNGQVQIAKWAVKLNNTLMDTITSTQNVTLTLSPNSFVADNRIAPDRSAYFDILLDPTGSEVAIDYLIKCDFANISGITNNGSDIEISGAEYWKADAVGTAGTGTAITVADLKGTNGIKIAETLAEVQTPTKIAVRVTLTWTHHETTEYNTADTANGVAAGTITLPVTVTARQHIAADDA